MLRKLRRSELKKNILIDKWLPLTYSLAVSIKMNILLFFPAFGFLIWQTQGIVGTIVQLVIMVLIQVSSAS